MKLPVAEQGRSQKEKRGGVTLKRNKEREEALRSSEGEKIGHWKLILIICEAYCYTEASWELGQAGMLGMVTINSQPQHSTKLPLTFLGGFLVEVAQVFLSHINNEEILIYLFIVWLFRGSNRSHVSKEN